jgi:KUP system potassium uptake protein
MVLTTLLAYVCMRRVWGWSSPKAGLVAAVFLVVDVAFFAANLLKIAEGGWFPLAFGILLFTVMTTWSRGRRLAAERVRNEQVTLRRFINRLIDDQPVRVPGTAVFLTANADAAPIALIRNLQSNRVLHDHVVLFTATSERVPHVPDEDQVDVERLRMGFVRVTSRLGFRDQPNVRAALGRARLRAADIDLEGATYFLNRVSYVPRRELGGMAMWRKRLFVALGVATPTSRHLQVPSDATVEIGTHVEL